ncbi:MAG: hypothetical protein WAK23_06790 [Terriglobales bacterium]|jgi:hypothetical protein
MAFAANEMLAEVRAEIEKLREVEAALLKTLGVPTGSQPTGQPGQPQKTARTTPAGSAVISIRARLRHAQEHLATHPLDHETAARVKTLESEYQRARAALDVDRKARGARVRS